MIAATFAALLATSTADLVQDRTIAARNAYTACLRRFMARSVEERATLAAFETALPQQCTTEEQAMRAAIIAREPAANRAQAEEDATLEVQDARDNIKQVFDISITPR